MPASSFEKRLNKVIYGHRLFNMYQMINNFGYMV